MFEVRVVTEGPTDVEVIRAVLDARLENDYVLTQLQPDGALYGGDAGPHGGGWKGVRGWCKAVARLGGLEAAGALHGDVKLLVIHVDADIASDPEIGVAEPCPPPMTTVKRLESVVLGWLGLEALPPRVALCIPSKAIEAWLLRSFFPKDAAAVPCLEAAPGQPCVECIPDPARELVNRQPRFVRMKRGELKKNRKVYEDHRRELVSSWKGVVQCCSTAKRLDDQLGSVIP